MPQKCLNAKSDTVKRKVGVNGSIHKAIFVLPQLAWLDPGSGLDVTKREHSLPEKDPEGQAQSH